MDLFVKSRSQRYGQHLPEKHGFLTRSTRKASSYFSYHYTEYYEEKWSITPNTKKKSVDST